MAWPKFRITTSTFLNFILDSLLFGQKYPCPSFNFWLKYLLSIFSSLARNVPCPTSVFSLARNTQCPTSPLWLEITLSMFSLARNTPCPTPVFSLARNILVHLIFFYQKYPLSDVCFLFGKKYPLSTFSSLATNILVRLLFGQKYPHFLLEISLVRRPFSLQQEIAGFRRKQAPLAIYS